MANPCLLPAEGLTSGSEESWTFPWWVGEFHSECLACGAAGWENKGQVLEPIASTMFVILDIGFPWIWCS